VTSPQALDPINVWRSRVRPVCASKSWRSTTRQSPRVSHLTPPLCSDLTVNALEIELRFIVADLAPVFQTLWSSPVAFGVAGRSPPSAVSDIDIDVDSTRHNTHTTAFPPAHGQFAIMTWSLDNPHPPEPPPKHLPAEMGVHIWRTAVVMPLITFIFVALRFYSRAFMTKSFRPSDCEYALILG
jgi:hypothetical protein